jgi:hypothetical protein
VPPATRDHPHGLSTTRLSVERRAFLILSKKGGKHDQSPYLTTCSRCNSEAYLPNEEAKDYQSRKLALYVSSHHYECGSILPRRVTLEDYAQLIEKVADKIDELIFPVAVRLQ